MNSTNDQRQTGNGAGTARCLYTVGHSSHDLPAFLFLIQRVGVTAVADVRTHPQSRRFPHFSRSALESALAGQGLAYVFLGDLLGGRPADPALYDAEGRAHYGHIQQTDAFRQGLDRLADGMERFTIAVVCSEEDPLDCHRGLMIAPALAVRGISVVHLRRDGQAESRKGFEQRLLEKVGLGRDYLESGDLFIPSDEGRRQVLAEAYRIQAARTAYRLANRPEGEVGGI